MGSSVQCSTNTDELAGRAAGTVYHCGSACAALANRSVTPIRPVPALASTRRLPGVPRTYPALRPLRNYKHSFHTKSSLRIAWPFETSPARVAFSLQIATHPLSSSSPPALFIPRTLSRPSRRERLVSQWSAAALFQISTITGYRARSRERIDTATIRDRGKGFIEYSKRVKSTLRCKCCWPF